MGINKHLLVYEFRLALTITWGSCTIVDLAPGVESDLCEQGVGRAVCGNQSSIQGTLVVMKCQTTAAIMRALLRMEQPHLSVFPR